MIIFSNGSYTKEPTRTLILSIKKYWILPLKLILCTREGKPQFYRKQFCVPINSLTLKCFLRFIIYFSFIEVFYNIFDSPASPPDPKQILNVNGFKCRCVIRTRLAGQSLLYCTEVDALTRLSAFMAHE